MKIPTSIRKRFANGKKLACVAALGLALAAFGATPALAGDSTGGGPAVISLGQLLGAVDEDDTVEQDGFVGNWVLVGVSSAEEGIEVGMEFMELFMDSGGITFDVYDDGTFVMSMNAMGESESVEGVWEQVDATSAVFTANDEPITAVLNEDGSFTIADEEVSMSFGRAEDVAAGKFASDGPAVSATIDDPQGFVYTWKLVAMDLPGVENDIPEELFSLAEAIGFMGVLDVSEDGTFVLEMRQGADTPSQAQEGTWSAVSDTAAILEIDGEPIDAVIEDGRLVLTSPDEEELALVFAALDPAALPVTGEAAFLGSWVSDVVFGEDGEFDPGADYYMDVYDDGTFEIFFDDGTTSDSAMGTWVYDEAFDEGWFEANGSELLAFVQEDELYMDYDGTNYLVFVRE